MPSDAEHRLLNRVAQELARPAPAAASALSDAIVARHGASVAAVLFYGSCLRRQSDEGVLDFYVLVDSYRTAHRSLGLALANWVLPPNVFYLELGSGEDALRAKYAVISCRDFERAVGPRCLHPYIWSRFAQPALLAFARDAAARALAERAVARAVVTLVQRLAPLLPAVGMVQRFSLATLWREALRRTYGAELRPEAPDTGEKLYAAATERFDAAASDALLQLHSEGWLDAVALRGQAVEVRMSPRRRRRARALWNLTRPVSKIVAFFRLLKTAMTFGEWLPYALWKLERHTGLRLEPSERQRRHPLIFGWPLFLKLVARRELR